MFRLLPPPLPCPQHLALLPLLRQPPLQAWQQSQNCVLHSSINNLTLHPRQEDLAAAQECLERAEALFLQCRDETHRDHDKIKRFRAALALKLASSASTPQKNGEN